MNGQVFLDPARAGVYHLTEGGARQISAASHSLALKVLEADVGRGNDCEAVLAKLGQSFHFPDWYGANFDALHDCLTDPDWQPAPGYILIISGLEKLRGNHPGDYQTLIEVFRSASEIRRAEGTPFWVLLDAAPSDIPPLPEA